MTTSGTWPVLVAGAAAVTGGALSVTPGECVSVPSRKDSQEALTGALGARLGGTPGAGRAAWCVVPGGALALGATLLIGSLPGVDAV